MISKIKNIKKRVSKSKDGKVLASNFGYLMLFQIASYAFPLITLPYLARVLGVEGFGKIAFAAAVIIWFQTITDWGFNYTATRDVARNRDNLEKVAEIFSNVFWAKVFLSLASLLILLILITVIPYFYENRVILLVTFALIPGRILFPEWYFQAMERMKYITIFNLIAKALFTVSVFIFIKDKNDFILQPILMSLGLLAPGIFAMYLIIVKWKVKIHKPQVSNILNTMKKSTDVFIGNVLPNLYYGFSTILLGGMSSVVSVGILDAGRKLIAISEQFLLVISRVFFPFLSRKSDKHVVYMKIHLSIAVCFCFFLFATAPILIKLLFTEEFYSAVTVVRISSLSIVFLSLRNIYGTNYLIIHGYEKDSRNIMLITSLFGLAIAFPLIYYFDFIGAALTATLTHCIQGLSMMYKANQISSMKVPEEGQ